MDTKYFLKRPNILFILSDQLRKDALGLYGSSYAHTPNIDDLGYSGMIFEHCYVQAPICMPSRAAIWSGRYCSSIGIGTNGIPVPEDLPIIPHYLKPYGYKTALFGKLHFIPHSFRNHKFPHPSYGFDEIIVSDEPGSYDDAYIKWVETLCPDQVNKVRAALPTKAKEYGNNPSYSEQKRKPHTPYLFEGDERLTHSAFVTDITLNFLERQQNTESPFFCTASYYAPHAPINPPQSSVDKIDISKMPLPHKSNNEAWSEDLEHISSKEWMKIHQYYLALTSHMDECIGTIIKKMKKLDLYDNTLIIFAADHGEYLGDHGKVHKGMPAEDIISNVPFIISGLGIQNGKRNTVICEAIDILPTILDYAGIQISPEIQGISLKPILSEKSSTHKEIALTEYFEPYGIKMLSLRNKKFRYFLSSTGEEQLYDCIQDSYNFHNLVNNDKYQQDLSFMRKEAALKLQKTSYPNKEKTVEY